MARSRLVSLASYQQVSAINLLSDPGAIAGKHVIPNTAQIRLRWSLTDGKIASNVLHGRYAGSYNGSQAQANSMHTAFTTGAQWTAIAAFLATGTSLIGVDIRDLGVLDQPIIGSATAAAPGTSSGTALPSEVSAVVTFRTAFTGPANRGRAYVPGWASNAVGAGDVIAAAAVTALGNWAALWAGFLLNQGYTMGVAHPPRQAYTGTGNPPAEHDAREAGLVPIIVTTVRDNHWDSQRRRGLK